MGHALNGSIQDVLIRLRAHARAAHQVDLRHRPRRHRDAGAGRAAARRARARRREEIGREAFVERVWEWREQYGSTIVEQFKRLGASLRLRGRALHDGRGLRARGHQGVRAPLREGPDLPRQLHGQLGPGPALGDLGPRGRAAPGRGHALLDRLPARVGIGLDHGRHRAARDDAGRHRDRGEPGRRALHAPDRRDGDPAAGRPPAADHRRRLRRPRVRHRRAQDHARPRPERLRDRPPPRARGDHGDRRGRPHDRGRRRALRGHGAPRRRAHGRGGRAARARA